VTGAAGPLVLASTSPQRRALLAQLGVAFRVVAPDYDEPPLLLAPVALVERHAREKARSVAAGPGDGPVIGVDTAVVVDGLVLGKPADADDASRMIGLLAGRAHELVSGLCVRTREREVVAHARTIVHFRRLGARQVAAYVATGEWRERAGGYAIQERGASIVAGVEGCYANVVGLPIALLVDTLETLGLPVL